MTTLGAQPSVPRPRRSSLAAALLVALVAGLVAALGPAAPATADDGGFGARMLELVNQQRAAAGVPALQPSPSLASVAEDAPYGGCGFPVSGRAKDMGVRNYFSHSILGCGTQSVFNVLSGLGIQTSGAGENIAWMSGTTDARVAAENLMGSLMASAGHRANILNPDFTSVGIGSWHTAAGQSWTGGGSPLVNVFVGVQVFARMTSTAPGAPTSVTATGGDGRVAVSWAPPGGASGLDSYGVFAWDTSGYTGRYATVCPTCSTATVTGLNNASTYYVTVYGHNAAGWGTPAYSPWVTVAAVPGPPVDVGVVPANAALTARWRPPSTPGAAIDGYGVFVFDANGYANQYAWVCATCTTATVGGLVNGRAYYAAVYPHNPNGWGPPTSSGWILVGSPGPPGNVTVSRGNGSVGVSWSPASNSGSGIDVYGVFVFDTAGYTGLYATACPTCTTATVAGLANGKPYTVWVYAHNAVGWGSPTVSGTVTPG